ncbi:hypothetical protein F5884DRAFT_30693 [Xylogone sp. PMI_703]|nr:hypothetical protein F5884DRAFT_30693 [Xylogone sp. PMI_703]
MPLVHIPTLRATVTRDLTPSEKNFVYALCGLTSTHMLGKSIKAHGPEPWDAVGTFFLDECISNRQQYDFVEDRSLSAVISSYLISSAYFELNQSRKTWYYLREAVTMGQDLGLHDENSYVGLEPSEALCRRRTFWILYVTERSFAILRHKPLALSKTPALPTSIHEYESPDIHTGFMRLIQSFHLLNSSFVDTWNEASSAPQSTQTYTLLQADLSITPVTQSLTSTQKADILVTQQWLRLIVWQSSMRQGLLSNINEIESMTFSYPLKIAYSLLSIISSLPGKSIEVHGMGIFEKIFEIGNAMLDVVHACGNAALVRTGYSGTAIGLGRGGIWIDPFEVFIRTLSQNPNSQTQYANVLLAKASERPEIMRYSGGIAPPLGLSAPRYDDAPPSSTIDTSGETVNIQERQTQNQRGRIIGEITADDALWETFTDLDADKAQEGIQTEGASIDPQEILGLDVMWDPGVVAGYDINDDFLDDMNVWAR